MPFVSKAFLDLQELPVVKLSPSAASKKYNIQTKIYTFTKLIKK